jgi:ornithine carbamoyltransferase
MRHFIDLLDISPDEVGQLFEEAARLKAAHRRKEPTPLLLGQVLGLIFEKPSLRTRVSFQAAMAQLGGASLFLSGKEVGLGTRESLADFARTLSEYVDGVVLRTFSHQLVEEFAASAGCPVINGLSDYYHPCQALADLFTMQELFGELPGRTLAFIGDGNNVARSLALCCAKVGVDFILASPPQYRFDAPFLDTYSRAIPGGDMAETDDPTEAVRTADVIYTDVWTSMGQEEEQEERRKHFAGFQVNEQLLVLAPPHARVMHCLPAHRGEEITSAVLDGPRSVVFQQAGNRMHAQKALLAWLLT